MRLNLSQLHRNLKTEGDLSHDAEKDLGTRIESTLVNNLIHLKVNFYQATSALGVAKKGIHIASENAQPRENPTENVVGCITLKLYVV